MKQKDLLLTAVNSYIEENGGDLFLVDITVSPTNDIEVLIERECSDVSIDDCVAISRYVESKLDREVEDFSLTVGSAGLTAPLTVIRQYRKFKDSEIQVTRLGGSRQNGILTSVNDNGIELTYMQSVKVEGTKKRIKESVTESIPFDQIKSAKAIIKF